MQYHALSKPYAVVHHRGVLDAKGVRFQLASNQRALKRQAEDTDIIGDRIQLRSLPNPGVSCSVMSSLRQIASNGIVAAALILAPLPSDAAKYVPLDRAYACDSVPVVSQREAEDSPAATTAITIPPSQIDSAIQALDGLVQEGLTRTGVPGLAIAVVRDDALVYAKGFGVRQIGTDQRVDENTVFQLASVSKPIGATVIAGVIGKGTVNWNTPVSKHLKDFKLADPYVTRNITVGDLYSHRSGLPAQSGDLLEDLGYDRAEILRRLRFEPLTPFRANYAYTNFGLTAAAEAVANAVGTNWEDLSEQILYKPLGMTSTSSRFADYANAPNRALLHVRVGSSWEAKYTRQPDPESPAGGVSSSVTDMANWLRLQLANGKYNGEDIIDTKALIQSRCPYMISGFPDTSISRASFYGLGMNVGFDAAGRLRFSHSGAFALGAATTFVLLPSENLGIIVLTNGMPVGLPEAIAFNFLDLVEFGKSQRDWIDFFGQAFAHAFVNPSRLAGKSPPTSPAPQKPNSAYTGTYGNSYYGPARIIQKAGGLVMVLGPQRQELPLTHWDGDTFSYLPQGESAFGIAAVDFSSGKGGRITNLTIENYDVNKLGTFKKQ